MQDAPFAADEIPASEWPAPDWGVRVLEKGGDWHVACESKEDARSLAEHMISFGGVPNAAVEVKQLAKCKRWWSL